ncbi:ubiquitin-like small modifier protein 1 [Candidatus Poriferisodalis sp.]|uniref:ubiquitin-like small modifier protein 1 n=1 Tax=Candidatus Poriferisodalis sp. TaxID=3101277 RepID=UPI003B52BF29
MAVTVRLPTVLRPHANGQSQVSAEAKTVAEAVSWLVGEFPGIAPNLLGDDGSLHRFVNVYVNDEDVRYLSQMDTALAEGDELSILPAVAGG